MSAARASQVCQSNVDQSPSWNKDFYLLPLIYTNRLYIEQSYGSSFFEAKLTLA